MRILLDTNILARAAAGPPGPAHELLLLATHHQHRLILSPFLTSELARVLRYPRLRPVHGLSDDEIDQFIADLILVAELIETPQHVVAVSNDPNDDPIIAAALEGQATVLCTLDRQLHEVDVKEYCQHRGITGQSDLELLARLRNLH